MNTKTTNIKYETYKPESGFEQMQADIYNSVASKYGGTTVTAKDIENRIKIGHPKQDTNGIRFAVDENGQGLAYIQYRLYTNGTQLYIGYPWARNECPPEVQDKLYNDLVSYLKSKFSSDEYKDLYLGYISNNFTDVVNWIKNKGFEYYNSYSYFEADLEILMNLEVKSDVEVKEASENDLNLLVDLGMNSSMKSMGEEGLRSYFRDKVLPDGNCIIIFKDNKPIASTAVLNGYFNNKASHLRFTAVRDGFDGYYTTLLKHTASISLKNGLSLPVRMNIGYKLREKRKFIIERSKEISTSTAYKKPLY